MGSHGVGGGADGGSRREERARPFGHGLLVERNPRARRELQPIDATRALEQLLGEGHVDHEHALPGRGEALRLELREHLERDAARLHHELERVVHPDPELLGGGARQEHALAPQEAVLGLHVEGSREAATRRAESLDAQ
jgi:hypothetical protein